MRILLLSKNGKGLGIANKLSQEGHAVAIFTGNGSMSGLGLVHLTNSWRPIMDRADLIIADDKGFESTEPLLRERGRVTFGFESPCEIVEDHYFTGWFNGRDWQRPSFEVWKYKRKLTGDLGPNVECMGVVTKTTEVPPSNNLAQQLKKQGFMGPINGFDYDVIEAVMEGLKESVTDLIFETAQGIKKEINITNDWLIAVRLTVPNSSISSKITGITKENLKHLFLVDTAKINGDYYCTGNTVLKATARGRSITEARKRVYRTLNNLQIQDKQYRLDIGEDIEHEH